MSAQEFSQKLWSGFRIIEKFWEVEEVKTSEKIPVFFTIKLENLPANCTPYIDMEFYVFNQVVLAEKNSKHYILALPGKQRIKYPRKKPIILFPGSYVYINVYIYCGKNVLAAADGVFQVVKNVRDTHSARVWLREWNIAESLIVNFKTKHLKALPINRVELSESTEYCKEKGYAYSYAYVTENDFGCFLYTTQYKG